MTGYDGDGSNVKTTVTIRRPSANPYAPLEGAEICRRTSDGWDLSTPLTDLALDNRPGNKLAETLSPMVQPAECGRVYESHRDGG